jgi:hypothetical protein
MEAGLGEASLSLARNIQVAKSISRKDYISGKSLMKPTLELSTKHHFTELIYSLKNLRNSRKTSSAGKQKYRNLETSCSQQLLSPSDLTETISEALSVKIT